jgi:GNAT superfamily N-acetyltransferase
MSLCNYRSYHEDDRNFILNSWLKSYKDSMVCKEIPSEIYYETQRELVSKVLDGAQVLVACSPESDKQIFGYIAYEHPGLIHYIYVKFPYRKFGIGTSLMEQSEVVAPYISTHLPRKHKKAPEVIYNPYLLWRLHENT